MAGYPSSTPLLPSHVFSEIFSIPLQGNEICHWCTCPCTQKNPHDDVVCIPFNRSIAGAKRPSSRFMCDACLQYKRPWVSARVYGTGKLKDRQCWKKSSWISYERTMWKIEEESIPTLYHTLLHPPHTFTLSLLREAKENWLHLCRVNDFDSIQADTEIWFTIDNIAMSYTVHELEHALQSKDTDGVGGGIRNLIDLLGDYDIPKVSEEDSKPKTGRPSANDRRNEATRTVRRRKKKRTQE